MKSLLRGSIFIVIAMLLLYACGGGTPTPPPNPIIASVPILSVGVTNGSTPFNTVGQDINYSYAVALTGGTAPLAGPVTVTDDKTIAPVCAGLNTVGNLDGNLDSGETVTCTSTYKITQNDLNAGAVVSNAVAKVGGLDSNRVTTTVAMTVNKVLLLTASASPASYSQANQAITFTYNLKNTGGAAVGPASFTIVSDRQGNIQCNAANSIIGPNETLTCFATYNIAQNDLSTNQLVFNLTASGGGASTAQPASVALPYTPNPGGSPPPVGNLPACGLTPGITCAYKLAEGDWMMQVYRCYGKRPEEVYDKAFRDANPGISNPSVVRAGTFVTLPNIGSGGKIYGAPCTTLYTVQSGDTWNSIEAKFNAAHDVMLEANKNVTLTPGIKLKIPLNSGYGSQVPPATDAIPLNITAGGSPAIVQGTLEVSKVKVRYVFAAVQGQTLNVKVTAPANEVALAIYAANNVALKAQDNNLNWNGAIPANGNYYIELVSVAGTANKPYTLEASLTQPISASFQRVADINTGAADSNPSYLKEFNGALYFNASGYDNTGAELWKYDPISKAASRVADIFTGPSGSNPTYLAPYNSLLYFGANGNDNSGTELWRFNGSAYGRLTEINGGAGNANPAYMTVFNNLLYFSATGSDNAGNELWRTDGNTANRVTDIYIGGDANPAYLVNFNNALYFSAISDDKMGNELWRFDGTTATRVTDINTGVGNANPAYMTVFNGVLYFGATGSDGVGNELWKFDGTTASRAADINPGGGDSSPMHLVVYNNALYFSANGNDGKGFELWKFDGTTATRLSDLNTAGDTLPAFLTVFNNELYFQANGGDNAGRELWKYKAP